MVGQIKKSFQQTGNPCIQREGQIGIACIALLGSPVFTEQHM